MSKIIFVCMVNVHITKGDLLIKKEIIVGHLPLLIGKCCKDNATEDKIRIFMWYNYTYSSWYLSCNLIIILFNPCVVIFLLLFEKNDNVKLMIILS